MNVRVCMYVCVFTLRMYMCVNVFISMYICMYVHIHTPYMYACIYMHERADACMYILRMHVAYVRTHIHIVNFGYNASESL
jgi:hypothetical protein